MKNKSVFSVAIISLVFFIGIASYLWYLYFHEYEGKLMDENCKPEFSREVELLNTGSTSYNEAKVDDTDSSIPTYYFSVKNNSSNDFNYVILFENSEVNDGCTAATRLERSELEYELRLDNKIIKTASLDTLIDNILDTNIIKGNSVNDYSLKIKLKSDAVDYQNKHFHYLINIKEKE